MCVCECACVCVICLGDGLLGEGVCGGVMSIDVKFQNLKGNSTNMHFSAFINPRRACARVTVLVLSVCLCVFPILAPRAIRRTNSSISDFSAIRA